MGCCFTVEKGWSERHDVVLDFMRGEGYLKTVWHAFKMNNNEHGCMEYDEFCALLFISLEIYDKIHQGTSRQLSHAMNENEDIELEYAAAKYKRKKKKRGDTLDTFTRDELNQRGDINALQQTLDEIAPKLAVQFDQDGDGVFSWDEFKELGTYLTTEYQKLCTGYRPPEMENESIDSGLLHRS